MFMWLVRANSSATCRGVSESPKWVRRCADDAGWTRAETGVLVDLEVDD
ncbi:MAG: hypothetical protein ACRDUA_21175 [Micromonosporaceae bacterium]